MKDKQFTYTITPDKYDGSITFRVEEVTGRQVFLEELLGVMAAYLQESCGEIGLHFAEDVEGQESDLQ